MGVRISKTYLAITGFSFTNEDGDFPKANAVNRSSSQLQARTTDLTETRYVVDCGSVQTTIEIYLDNINFPTFKFQESADGSTGWSDIGATITVAEDDVQGVYRYRASITMDSKQYLGIWVAGSQTPTDGASVYKFGTIAIPTNVAEFPAKTIVGFPFSKQITDENVIINQFPDGSDEDIVLGSIMPMTINFELETEVDTPNIAGTRVNEVMGYFRNKSNTLYIDFNLGETWQAYLVKNRGNVVSSLSTPFLKNVVFGTQILKVII